MMETDKANQIIIKSRVRIRRRKLRGANLALLLAVAMMLVALLGISIYSGLQAFIQNDLQRVTTSAALAGASAYYSSVGADGKPAPNPDLAKTIATTAFDNAVTSTSLRGFNAQVLNVSHNDSNDSITITSNASVATPFLAVVGIQSIQANARASARALKYEPTRFTGPVSILPDSANINSYSRTIQLAFPMVDGPGNDIYVEQDSALQQGVVVEACNDTECYNLAPGMTPVGTSQLLSLGGAQVLFGTAVIDLQRAGVRKGDKLRFTHANQFDSYNAGVMNPVPAVPTPLVIRRVFVFGYAGNCVDTTNCSIPAGFEPVE